MTGHRKLSAAALSLALLTAACGGSAGEATTTNGVEPTTTTVAPEETTTVTSDEVTTTQETTTTVAPDETTSSISVNDDGSDGSGCTPDTDGTLSEGRWFGYVVSTAADSIEFDLACMFTGQAAIDAAAEDGEESPPPNDYYVRNQNELIRTVVVWSDASVQFYPTGDPTSETHGTFGDWTDAVSGRGYTLSVWLDVIDGEATAITEQWVP